MPHGILESGAIIAELRGVFKILRSRSIELCVIDAGRPVGTLPRMDMVSITFRFET